MHDLSSALWRTSRRSGTGNNCVEVAGLSDAVGIRDSKDREGGHLALSAARWNTFAEQVKAGSHDL